MKRIMVVALLLTLFSLPAHAAQGGGELSPTGELSIELLYPQSPPAVDRYLLLYDPAMGPPPDPYRYWRIPDRIIPLPREGTITLPLPSGSYWFSVAHKKEGALLGPPRNEELFYLHADEGGKASLVSIEAGKRRHLGRHRVTTWVPSRVEREKGITAVEGVVVDPAGKPLEGMNVFASLTDYPAGKPLYISDSTDAAGRFLLRVAEGGVYYLRARGIIGGGTPSEGEYLSGSGEFSPVRVEPKSGERLRGVRMVARPFSRVQPAIGGRPPGSAPRGGP